MTNLCEVFLFICTLKEPFKIKYSIQAQFGFLATWKDLDSEGKNSYLVLQDTLLDPEIVPSLCNFEKLFNLSLLPYFPYKVG